MKAKQTWMVIISAVVLASCMARRSEPIKQRYFDVKDARVQHGQVLYMEYCYKCHPGGEGGLGPAINSNPAPQFIKRFQVRHGLGVMPSFKPKQISRSELHDISRYMRQLKKY